MAINSFTTTTSQGFFQRVGGSIMAVILGPVFIIGAALLVFYNERHAVHVATSLREGAAAVVEASADKVDPGFEGKLVHLTGKTKTDDPLRDPDFGVEYAGVKLARAVEVYEWVETSRSRSSTNAAGTKTTTTTYEYETKWSDHLIDSSTFREKLGHSNPGSIPYQSKSFQAESVTLGEGFQLDSTLAEKIQGEQALPLTAEDVKLPEGAQLQPGGIIYVGNSPSNPALGDLRVTEKATPNAEVSVIAAQKGSMLTSYETKNGEPIALLDMGNQGAAQMFQAAQSANAILAWILRAVSFVVLFIGIRLIFGPISMLASIVPIFGALVGGGLFLISFLLALICWVLLVGAAWITARPLVALPLFGVAVLALVAFVYLWIKRHAAHTLRQAALVPPGLPGDVVGAS